MLVAIVCAACADLAQDRTPGASASSVKAHAVRDAAAAHSNLGGLRTAVLAYAGRYREKLGFAIDSAMPHTKNPVQRLSLQATKVSYVSATFGAATGPDPVLAVRDLVISAQLQRLIWDDPKREADFPRSAVKAIRGALARLESQINELAETMVEPRTLAKLHALVVDWRAANPEQDYVAFVHLDTTAAADVDSQWTADAHQGGFLAPVSEAARQIALAKETGERALFLVNQLPMLAEWNAELLVRSTLASPEAAAVLNSGDRFTKAAEGLRAQLADLPRHIADERKALLRQFLDGMARERALALADVAARVEAERRAVLEQLARTAGDLQPLAESVGAASMALRETTASLERLFPPAPAGKEDRDVLASLGVLLERAALVAGELRALTEDVRPLLDGSAGAHGFAALDAALARHERRLFFYGAGLVLLAGVLALAVVWYARHPRAAG